MWIRRAGTEGAQAAAAAAAAHRRRLISELSATSAAKLTASRASSMKSANTWFRGARSRTPRTGA